MSLKQAGLHDAIRIVDENDPRIEHFRAVRDADLRGRDGLFCVESPRVVRRFLHALLAHRRGAPVAPTVVPHSFFLTDDSALSMAQMLNELRDMAEIAPVPLYLADHGLMSKVSGYKMHMGALALGTRPSESTFDQLLSVLPPADNLVVADGVVLTDNIGAIFRNSGSFGRAGVLLGQGSSDPLHRKVIRVSSGRVFSVPWGISTDFHRDLARLREDHGFALIAAEDTLRATPLEDVLQIPAVQNARRVAVILGSEGSGVSAEIRALCDATVVIPMAPPNALMESSDRPSLNVAIASALFLHRLRCTSRHPGAKI